MRFLVIGDLHGQRPRIPDDVDFDAIIVPGDVCSDEGIRKYMMQSLEEYMHDKEAPTWYDLAGRERAQELVEHSLSVGREIMESLDALGVPVFAIPGNWDWTGEESDWELLTRNLWSQRVVDGLENVIDLDDALLDGEEFSFVGYGRVNGPELLELRDYEDVTQEDLDASREEYEALFDAFARVFEEAQHPVVFLSHNVPYDTSLDVIKSPGNPQDGKHFGSVLARELVEEYQPLVCIGGHIHEHYGTEMIGETVCLNAGFGPEKMTLVEISDGDVSVTKL